MDEDFKIGKKLLLTLTTGMYVDSLFLYREYVQNAADAIDDAVKNGLMCLEDAQIEIQIDAEAHTITIEDNATGIPAQDVHKSLGNIGDSAKNPQENKGFIGIGRLGGLGYCKKMIFETSYSGEDQMSIVEWDAERLFRIIGDSQLVEDANEVLKQTTLFRSKKCKPEEHFFRVRLEDVAETHGELLDVERVRQYLSLTAPVPFKFSRFKWKNEIRQFAEENALPSLCEYTINLNHDSIYKGYESTVEIGSGRKVEIKEIVCGLLEKENQIFGWYWYGITCFDGQLPSKCLQRGLRLRKGNIQIGEADCLRNKNLWPEDRGNKYFMGEIHVIHPDLVPNARRDYFNTNTTCRIFEDLLRGLFKDLWEICRGTSQGRSCVKKIEASQTKKQLFHESEQNGYYNNEEREKKIEEIKTADQEEQKARKDLKKIQENFQSNGDKSPMVRTVVSKTLEEYANIQEKHKPVEDVIPTCPTPSVAFKSSELSKTQRKVLDKVRAVLESQLSPESFEAVWNEIQKVFGI